MLSREDAKQGREMGWGRMEGDSCGHLRFCSSSPDDGDGGYQQPTAFKNLTIWFPSLLWWICSFLNWGSLCPSQAYTFSLSSWITPFSYTLSLVYKSKIFLCQLTIAFLQTKFTNRLCCKSSTCHKYVSLFFIRTVYTAVQAMWDCMF